MYDFKIYRYGKKEHLKNMMENGVIRITTLSACRKSENEKSRDENDGKKSVVEELKGKSINEELRKIGFMNVEHISGTVNKEIRKENIDDCYIYCTSSIYNHDLQKKWGGSCIEIFDPHNFCIEIDKELSKLGLIYPNSGSGDYIKYKNSRHIYVDDVHVDISANWIKEDKPEFVNEKEFRFSFVPIIRKDGVVVQPTINEKGSIALPTVPEEMNLEPVLIKSIEAIKYCKWKDCN